MRIYLTGFLMQYIYGSWILSLPLFTLAMSYVPWNLPLKYKEWTFIIIYQFSQEDVVHLKKMAGHG